MTYKEALLLAQWEAEQNRPWDWQDLIVMFASIAVFLLSLYIILTT